MVVFRAITRSVTVISRFISQADYQCGALLVGDDKHDYCCGISMRVTLYGFRKGILVHLFVVFVVITGFELLHGVAVPSLAIL